VRTVRLVALGVAVPLLLVVAAGCATCAGLLPERFAVNGPMWHQMTGMGGAHPSQETLAGFQVPDGFRVGLFASDIDNARMLRFSAEGDLLVSSPRAGKVLLLLRDDDGDGRSDGTRTLLEGLDRPHGLDFHDGWLYVAEGSAVGRVRFDARARATSGEYERVVEGLPSGGNHWTRTVGFGPDGWMYVSIGSSCNVCEEGDPRRAAMLRYRPDGSGEEIYATGLRNSVGFDWQPATGDLYATDNGRDLLGDDFPPCELNRIERGRFYGWPYANGDRVPDPDFGEGHRQRVEESVPPVHGFRPHNAPLGMRFIGGETLPARYRGAALVALHGSWNRTTKDGYKVVSLHWRDGGIEERDFLTGFLRGEEVVGRPVDVAEGLDGALYVSDDYGDAIYRVVHGDLPAGGGMGSGMPTTSESGRAAPAGAAGASGADPGRGRALYASHACAGCHEPERAAPGVVARPLAALSARYDLATLTAFLAAPAPPMPPVELPQTERRDLAAYLLERHP
jgi:glucose/arabinose dehydrogenase/mono/diheme cytochrome c family protein